MLQTLEIEDVNIYSWEGLRPLDKIISYAKNELAWYFSCDREASFIVDKAKIWDKIKTKDNTLNSNYGYLVFKQQISNPDGYVTMSGFDWALHCLKQDKFTRRAAVVYNSGAYNYEPQNDFICTQGQLFYIRNGRLDCYITLRSSDAIFGLPYNYIFWSSVHQKMFLNLIEFYPDLKLGKIIVTVLSAHIYKTHYELVSKMIEKEPINFFLKLTSDVTVGMPIKFYLENFNKFWRF